MKFRLYGDKARAVEEGQLFLVAKTFTIEGHPVAELVSQIDDLDEEGDPTSHYQLTRRGI